jgi:hypothetical protein
MVKRISHTICFVRLSRLHLVSSSAYLSTITYDPMTSFRAGQATVSCSAREWTQMMQKPGFRIYDLITNTSRVDRRGGSSRKPLPDFFGLTFLFRITIFHLLDFLHRILCFSFKSLPCCIIDLIRPWLGADWLLKPNERKGRASGAFWTMHVFEFVPRYSPCRPVSGFLSLTVCICEAKWKSVFTAVEKYLCTFIPLAISKLSSR